MKDLIIPRRHFLIGSAASIAATTITPAHTLPIQLAEAKSKSPVFRWIDQIVISPTESEHSSIRWEFFREDPTRRERLMEYRLPTQSVLQWTALPNHEIVTTPAEYIRVTVEPAILPSRLELMYRAGVSFNAERTNWKETFYFKDGKVVDHFIEQLDLEDWGFFSGDVREHTGVPGINLHSP